MSSFALKGALTGLFQGLSEGLVEEREKTQTNLANQLKTSYQNMQTYNKYISDMQNDILARDEKLRQFAPDLGEEERIAAATMPDLLTVYQNLTEKGVQVNIKDLIKVGDKAKGGNFDTWVANLKQLQQSPEYKSDFVISKDDFFTPSAERQQKMLREMSATLGTTPEQLSRFKEIPLRPSLAGYGSFSKEILDKLRNVPSLGQQLEDSIGRVGELTVQYGKDSPEVKEASMIVNKLKDVKKTFTDPKEASWTATLDNLNLKLLGERDPAKRASLKKQISEWVQINELSQKTDNPIVKPLTYNQYYGQWSKAASSYFSQTYGKDFLTKYIVDKPDGGYDFVGTDPEIKKRTNKEFRQIALSSLRQYITNGKAINLDLQNFLENIVKIEFLTPSQIEAYRTEYNRKNSANLTTEEATQQLIDSGRMVSITGR